MSKEEGGARFTAIQHGVGSGERRKRESVKKGIVVSLQ